MEPPAQISCPGNCLIHLHSAAGKAWLARHVCDITQSIGRDGITRFLFPTGNNEPELLSAHEIRTFLFRKILADFERLNGFPVQNLIAIIPASKNPRQYLSEISAAAKAAGSRIVVHAQRSVVAASYYNNDTPERKTVLVFELGGHFLEISLLTKDQGLKIRAAVFDLGCPLFHYVVSSLRWSIGCGITLRQILTECERAKDAICSGSGNVQAKFDLPLSEMTMTINREWLEWINLKHLRSGITRCLNEAGLRSEAVNEVVLAGASTNIPAVRNVLQEFFQTQPFRCSVDPANLIDVSSEQCMKKASMALNIPLVTFMGFNFGFDAL